MLALFVGVSSKPFLFFCFSVYFSMIFDLSSSFSAVDEGVVIVLVSIAAVGSLLADIVVPVSSKLQTMLYSAAY